MAKEYQVLVLALEKKTFSILKQRYSNKIYPSGFDPY